MTIADTYITRESLINFKRGARVSYRGEKGRLEKIHKRQLIILFDTGYKVVDYSKVRISDKPLADSRYDSWTDDEIRLIMSGMSIKDLRIRLGRSTTSIYQKMYKIRNQQKNHKK